MLLHVCAHTCMYACTCKYTNTLIYLHSDMKIIKIKASALYELESDVSPGKTEVKQGN